MATDGNDRNPGTLSQPWRTIQQAADRLVPGETVYVRGGTYNETVTPRNSGMPGAPITFTAYPGETVYIDGSGITTTIWSGTGDPPYSMFDISRQSYINVSGFTFIHAYTNGIYMQYADHLLIEGNTFNSDFGWSPIFVPNNCHDIEVRNNYIHRTYITTPGYYVIQGKPLYPWAEMISISASSNISVHHNTVDYNPLGEGINFKNGTHDSVAYHNFVANTHSAGMYIGGWVLGNYNIEYYDNLVTTPPRIYPPNNQSDGNSIVIANEKADQPDAVSSNLAIYNNIVYNSRVFGVAWYGTGTIDGVRIANNTFFNLQHYFFGSFIPNTGTTISNMRVRNNIFDSGYVWINTVRGYPIAAADHNGFHNTTGSSPFGTDSVVGDPRFADPGAVDMHLTPGSPMIDAGTATDAPSLDREGVPRPQGAGYDIGAYEYRVPPAAG